jgi:DegV family protein with EDD domain
MDPSTRLDATTTAVVTDSAADLPVEGRAPNWRVVSIPLHFGSRTYRPGEDIDAAEFYRLLPRADVMPTTSQPSAADLEAVYREVLEDYDSLLVLHLSGKLSGTVDAARAAAREIGEERVAVIETARVSLGLAQLVHRVQARLEAGTTLAEVEDFVSGTLPSSGCIFTVETLEFLQRGGRIGRAQALAGSMLRVRPILALQDGEVGPIGRVRGGHRVLPAMRAALEERTEARGRVHIALGHADRPEGLAALEAMVREARPEAVVDFAGELGPTVGTHGGPGLLGLGYLHDPVDR